MAECTTNINLISEDEYIGDSLSTINQNFKNLKDSACDLESKLDRQVNIRTFFYYGPNTPTDNPYGTAGMDNAQLSRPSDELIEKFVNDADKLNLNLISEKKDIAYVVYQKTGWYQPPAEEYTREGSGSIPFTKWVTYTVSYQVIAGGGSGKKKKIAIGGKCWVAREAYEGYSPKWEVFKDWLFDSGHGPTWLQKIYLKYGEGFAQWVSTKNWIKRCLRTIFNTVVNKQDLKDARFVATPDGPIKAENIKIGDVVYGYDHFTGETKKCKVIESKVIEDAYLARVYHENGELVLPFSQGVYVEDGNTGEGLQYINTDQLKPGDILALDGDEKSKILKIETIKSDKPIQKIEVEDSHNYFLNGVKVHNYWVSYTVTRLVTYYVGYNWTTNLEDIYKQYEPIFVLYRLTNDGQRYTMDSGWPKYTRASTQTTNNWNSPQLWSTY